MKLWQTFSQWSATSWTRLGCVLASVLALNSLGVVVSQTVPIIASLGYHVGSDGIARMLSWRFFATVGTVLIGTALKSGSLKTVFPPRVLAAVCLAIVATCGATLCQPSTTLSFPVFRVRFESAALLSAFSAAVQPCAPLLALMFGFPAACVLCRAAVLSRLSC